MVRLSQIDLRSAARSAQLTDAELADALPRAPFDIDAAAAAVSPVLASIKERGLAAAMEASERFDGIRPEHMRVPHEVLEAALAALDPHVRAAISEAAGRVRRVDSEHLPSDHTVGVIAGGTVTKRWIPMQRVGVYVPGGRAPLPSSVVMNVVPAQVAGVTDIVVASPPHKEHGGYPHPTILAACALLGVSEVLAVGGAQAIGVLAYGLSDDGSGQPLAPVDLIAGPGNVYVAAAKRLVSGTVGIDSEAGPTEIAILADDTADPRFVAADLVSQAEHDPLAAAVLVTTSTGLVEQVHAQLDELIRTAPHHERITQALAGQQSAVVLVDDLEAGLRVVNAYGAEHLEIHTHEASEVASRVTNAGAVFIGPYSPVSLGDYAAGSNHVLPTGGTSRFSSGLSAQTYLRGVHVIEYSKDALNSSRQTAVTLAKAENLPSHGQAIEQRFASP